MATPDLSAYTDLVLYDTDSQALVNRALLDLEAKLPGVTLTPGSLEVVLLEAFGLAGAEIVYALNRIPSAVIDLLMAFTGAQRSVGLRAAGTATFTVAGTAGATIPAGTAATAVTAEDMVFQVTTDTDLIIAAGQSTGTVPVTVTDPGADANGVPAQTRLELVAPNPFVDDVTLATVLAGGADPEDDNEWMQRAVAQIARFTDLYVLPRHFQVAALSTQGVTRAKAVNNWNSTTSSTAGGHITVAIAGPGGAPVQAAVKTAVTTDLVEHASADLAVHVVDATMTTVNVAVTVMASPGATVADVQAAVQAQMVAYLDPDQWPWAGAVRRNELIAAADRADGVDYVVTVATPAADQALTGLAPLAKAGTVTVTVQQP